MGWLHRLRPHAPPETPDDAPGDLGLHVGVRATPGVDSLFQGLRVDGHHAVLDMGAAAAAHLDLFGPFARRVRFADMLAAPPSGPPLAEALRALVPPPGQAYDIVLAWDLLDRSSLVDHLVELTTGDARLYVVVDTTERSTAPPLRFTLQDLDRVRQEATGPPQPVHPRLLPAQLERLLSPFEVTHAFTLKDGLREYVAVRRR